MDAITDRITQRDQAWKMLLAAEVEVDVANMWLDPLNDAAERFEINTKLRLAHWLATLIHESAGFERLEENLNYSAKALYKLWPNRFTPQEAADYARKPEMIANRIYGNRMGNENDGDGWLYRGRGCIQLTGRFNYQQASDAIEVDLIAFPDALLADKDAGALVAAWFWREHGCNELADKDDTTAIRKRINGGTIGLIDVAALVANLKRA